MSTGKKCVHLSGYIEYDNGGVYLYVNILNVNVELLFNINMLTI